MTNLSSISTAITTSLDYVLGWLLDLPRDVAIVILAVATSLVLTLVRKWFTNQDLLRRCAVDVRRLRQLIRQARSGGDRPAVRRMKGTVSLIKLTQLRAEGRVLLWSLVPVALLATWAIERLDCLPPAPGEQLVLRAYYPLSSVDKLTHLVPPDGFDVKAPVQAVQLDADEANGVATWVLSAPSALPETSVLIRHQGRTIEHRLRVDGRIYSPPLQQHDADFIPVTELQLAQAKFLGVLPGLPQLYLAPWIVAYLLLTLALVPALRRLLRVW